MPTEIVTRDGERFEFRPFELPPLEPDSVRIRVEFASPKHGTESHLVTGSAFDTKRWDGELRMFLPREPGDAPSRPPEHRVGNMVVGVVTETGPAVSRFRAGDRVFTYGPVREAHQAPEARVRPLQGLTPADAVCTDPAHVAFVAVRDGNIRVGDDVAVFGLGAIGLLAVQIARVGGARRVFAVDPLEVRRAAALRTGAASALDPVACDAALEIKRATGGAGVDVSIETSGNGRALHESIRCLRQCGTVVHVPWGPKDAAELRLDEEFHLNRPTIIGSQAVWDNPDRSHPLWTEERARQAAIDLFADGLIAGEPIVTPIVPFGAAPEALREMIQAPERCIKIGVTFA